MRQPDDWLRLATGYQPPNTEVYSPKVKVLIAGIGWLPSSYQDPGRAAHRPGAAAGRAHRADPHLPPGAFSTASTRPPSQTQVLFGTISYLLEHYPLPPALRAGLYRVLTRLDGVKLIGGVTDLAGRRGVSVGIDVDGDRPVHERDELLLDPATGRLLGARSVLTRQVPGWRVPAGTVIDERVVLEASVLDSRTTRPESRPLGS